MVVSVGNMVALAAALVGAISLAAFASLNVLERAREIGRAAMERVRDDFLAVRSLLQYLALFEKLRAVTPPAA